jgi:hypothetical protein
LKAWNCDQNDSDEGSRSFVTLYIYATNLQNLPVDVKAHRVGACPRCLKNVCIAQKVFIFSEFAGYDLQVWGCTNLT